MGGVYQKIFANYYDSFMESVEERLEKSRRALLNDLQGNILEIGSGTGVNFRFYSPEASVTAIEPSLPMLEKSKPKQRENISLYNIGIDNEELQRLKPEQGFDVVVCTLVLCTVPNLEKALTVIDDVLSESGKLIVLEHIHAKKEPKATFENIVNPVWRIIGEGCNLNRSTDEMLEKRGFYADNKNYFKLSFLDFFQGVYHRK